MSTKGIMEIHANDAPEFISILLCALLFKLGGQVVLTMGEIEEIHSQFPSIRFALSQGAMDVRDEAITMTLRSRDHIENDRPQELP
jgi:hypothetical protein